MTQRKNSMKCLALKIPLNMCCSLQEERKRQPSRILITTQKQNPTLITDSADKHLFNQHPGIPYKFDQKERDKWKLVDVKEND